LSWIERAKELSVTRAIESVKDGQIIGLGTGTTVAVAVKKLAEKIQKSKLNIRVVPTSNQIELLAIENHLELASLNEVERVDFAIDGADEVELGTFNMIKGAGAALTREKIVDNAAKKLVIVVDETKIVEKLGSSRPLPVEVLPFAYRFVERTLRSMGARVILREGNMKAGPIITDNGNFILDANFGPMEDPAALEAKLKFVPGIIETGLFLGMATEVFVGKRDGSVQVFRSNRKV